MTAVLTETRARVLPIEMGVLECDGCANTFTDTACGNRETLRTAAAGHGWRQTVGGLDVCADCATGPFAIFVPGFAQLQQTPNPQVDAVRKLLRIEAESTAVMPAVRTRPYDTQPMERAS